MVLTCSPWSQVTDVHIILNFCSYNIEYQYVIGKIRIRPVLLVPDIEYQYVIGSDSYPSSSCFLHRHIVICFLHRGNRTGRGGERNSHTCTTVQRIAVSVSAAVDTSADSGDFHRW